MEYTKMHDAQWIAIIVIILAILIGYNKYCECACDEKIIWFYQDGCGHCVRMKDEWAAFVRVAPKYMKIQSLDIFDPANARVVKEFGVQGVPYIVKVKNGRKYVYTGPRKAADLLHWSIN